MGNFICIDLKSFYASAECTARGLDPLNTNLVVADSGKTEKTICLAVSPSLKSIGVPGRPRLFEVIQIVKDYNKSRLRKTSYGSFMDKSIFASEITSETELDFIIAPPRMKRYMDISTQIYNIYLRYISPDDIHVYSIDEVFIDASGYLKLYKCTAKELAIRMIRDVLRETGITATAGIGTNMYLAKIAMDIMAKKMPADKNGVRIAELDELSYRKNLWEHTPLTDFWRIGNGYARKLADLGLYTMGDIARFSEYGENKLFHVFGVAAEFIIDHAWGYEPCTMKAIKEYIPKDHSISQGQVLSCPYDFEKGKLIICEMTELLVLDLVRKCLVTDKITLTIGYDHTGIPSDYRGKLETDRYGKTIPHQAHGTIDLGCRTSSTKLILKKVVELYSRITDPDLSVRRMYVTANHAVPKSEIPEEIVQYSLFDDIEKLEEKRRLEKTILEKENKLQKTVLDIKGRFGKNAILKGLNFREGATTIERNGQVGGHKA